MARLADGIARRADRLRREMRDLPEAHRKAVDELVRAAGDATGLARSVNSAPDAPPDSGTALRQMDMLTSRLLEIATALDDALAAAGSGTESTVLRRLEHDAEQAQHALPELRRAAEKE